MVDRSFVRELDTYEGSLSLELDKLELERRQGSLNQEEQADFLGDLQMACARRWIAPRRRALRWALLGLGLSLLLIGLHPGSDPDGPALLVRLPWVLGGACALAAGVAWLRLRRARGEMKRRLDPLRTRLAETGSLFEG